MYAGEVDSNKRGRQAYIGAADLTAILVMPLVSKKNALTSSIYDYTHKLLVLVAELPPLVSQCMSFFAKSSESSYYILDCCCR